MAAQRQSGESTNCLISQTRRSARRLRRESTGQEGWVSVGTDPDTAEFAVQTIRCWWRQSGSKAYSEGRELLIMSEAGRP
jgi:hypothetical protein